MMNNQTVGELIELLQQFDPDQPVLIAHQPSWPLAETVANVLVIEADDEDDEPDTTVWIVAGGHPDGRSPYAPNAVFEGGGW